MRECNGLLLFWFNTMRPYWFGCPPHIDENVFKTFNRELEFEYEETNNIKFVLSRIILYEQISRNILKFKSKQEDQHIYDSKALYVFETSGILYHLDELREEERCFALMPLRHTFLEHNLHICLDLVSKWLETSSHPMYIRFYQATVKAISKINNIKNLRYTNENINIGIYRPILDSMSPFCFNIKMPKLSHHLAKEFMEKCAPKNNQVIISVSGGVDSMVCLHLASVCYPSSEIKAISINYANREEQKLEIDMVNYICRKLNIKHYVRTIDEIKRVRDSHRTFYETLTREIRFKCYKNIMDSHDIPVILGHNQDDTLENVFSNIKKRINYDNLFGMENETIEKNVTILRPLLNITKTEIINYAQEYNIPYTYDSTPSWSERGRLRDVLIPSIKTFDRDLVPGMIEMANNFKEIYEVYKNSLPNIVLIDDNISKSYYEIQCDKPIYILDYWKRIFQ